MNVARFTEQSSFGREHDSTEKRRPVLRAQATTPMLSASEDDDSVRREGESCRVFEAVTSARNGGYGSSVAKDIRVRITIEVIAVEDFVPATRPWKTDVVTGQV